jgi:hypothetical protein
MPAVYLHRSFSTLVAYSGSKPWTGDQTYTRTTQAYNTGPVPLHRNSTERWVAYLRPSDDTAVGLYFPSSAGYVAYLYGPPDRAQEAWTCSYVAPISSARLTPGATFAYKAYMAVGSVDSVRAAFQQLQTRAASIRQ